LRQVDPPMPEGLRGRVADNWRHLLAIADLAGGEWPERARTSAETLSRKDTEQTAGIMLLTDLQRIFADKRADVLSSAEITDALKEMEDRPWPEWGRSQKPITQNQIARLLKPFDIRPEKFRADGYTPGTRGYELENLKDTFSRYIPGSQTATPPQTNGGAGFSGSQTATDKTGVAVADPRKAAPALRCGGVAVESPEKEVF